MILPSRRPFLSSFSSAFLCAPTIALLVLLSPLSVMAASALEIRVQDDQGQALPGAIVAVSGTSREALSGADGVARLENVPVGVYDLTSPPHRLRQPRVEIEVRIAPPRRQP